VQKLVALQSLCKACHGVKHFGFSRTQGKGEEAIKHFVAVNKMSRKSALKHIEKCFQEWEIRSKKKWKLDISFLSTYGIDITNTPNKETIH
jgi:hypothetical protein